MQCRECGKNHSMDNEFFCPECQEKKEKRDGFRKLMQMLNEIAELNHERALFMSGFSYAEMERFSLIFIKMQKRFHWPKDITDFMTEINKTRAKELLGGV